ncbi:MAG: (d)CMP kinase [Candidatus Pristimantibacillus lignocellulolyticus]|uniref:Cytidylate kinase n=1 Tax=Candidatus Pristimantibacillus lignocellulolyticus TaxID=2994561 RepID=A0A9J6ZE16_9BACL|nr:MAG: (d)CMP kinase [Candidatus Pristimantibacillus lignocellulolyticus]
MLVQGMSRINIAIDGPAGAGKSTVARQVASKLGYVYVDTGSMYRAVTLYAQRNGVSANQSSTLQQMVAQLEIELIPTPAGQMILLQQEDVTGLIRTREVTTEVSHYASDEHVRSHLSKLQRELAANKGIVMDGRDIGTHVLPDAELKIFLTASVQERALRRYKELTTDNYIPLEQLEAEIATRDKLDETREIAPLIQADDAILIDSSHIGIDEVTDLIVSLSQKKLAEVIG